MIFHSDPYELCPQSHPIPAVSVPLYSVFKSIIIVFIIIIIKMINFKKL